MLCPWFNLTEEPGLLLAVTKYLKTMMFTKPKFLKRVFTTKNEETVNMIRYNEEFVNKLRVY